MKSLTQEAEDSDAHQDYWSASAVPPGRCLQKNSVSIDLILRTIRLLAKVTKASLGKIKTAP